MLSTSSEKIDLSESAVSGLLSREIGTVVVDHVALLCCPEYIFLIFAIIAMQFNAMQCNAMQCNEIQCNTMQKIQSNTIQKMQCNAILYNTTLKLLSNLQAT